MQTCESGFIFDDKNCFPCSPNCLTCEGPLVCTECDTDYELTYPKQFSYFYFGYQVSISQLGSASCSLNGNCPEGTFEDID